MMATASRGPNPRAFLAKRPVDILKSANMLASWKATTATKEPFEPWMTKYQ